MREVSRMERKGGMAEKGLLKTEKQKKKKLGKVHTNETDA